MSSIDKEAKNKLAALMAQIQPIIYSHIEEMSVPEINYILSNFKILRSKWEAFLDFCEYS